MSPSSVPAQILPPCTAADPTADTQPPRTDRAVLPVLTSPTPPGVETKSYLGSAELASVCSLPGRIPTRAEYMSSIGVIADNADEIYRYMNFDKIEEFRSVADKVQIPA